MNEAKPSDRHIVRDLLVVLGIGQGFFEKRADAQASNGTKIQVPRFEVDPTFPKPLPNTGTRDRRSASAWTRRITSGSSIAPDSLSRDAKRRSTTRPARAARRRRRFSSSISRATCCATGAAATVRRLSVAGVEPRHHDRSQRQRLDRRQRRRRRPRAEVHAGRQVPDAMSARRVSRRRQQRARSASARSRRSSSTRRPNEVYIADGYGNKRVAVIDADTGKIEAVLGRLRQQAGRCEPGPLQPRRAARRSSSARRCTAPSMSNDRIVYVCDRVNDRIQVVHAGGQVHQGSAGLASEHARRRIDLGHRVLEGPAAEVHVPRRRPRREGVDPRSRSRWRSSPASATGGKQPGQFYAVHSIATDSKGNIYTTETYDGRRLQRFIYKGMQTVTKGEEQGTVWPQDNHDTIGLRAKGSGIREGRRARRAEARRARGFSRARQQ